MQGTDISEVAAGRAEPNSPACVSSNSYERVLQPTTVSQDGDRIHGLGMPPLIAATGLTSSPAGAAALILVTRRFPLSTRTARSGSTHQASWLESQRCSINELMESQYGASSCAGFGDLGNGEFFKARERARARARVENPEPPLA